MIPIGPIIWVLWAASRAASRRQGAPTQARAAKGMDAGRLLVYSLAYIGVLSGLVMLAAALEQAGHPWQGALCGLFAAFGGPLLVLCWLPHWLVFRVLRPAGLRQLALTVTWLTPHRSARDRVGALALVRALHPLPPGAGSVAADAWTVCAAALYADAAGDAELADQGLLALAPRPQPLRVHRGVRVYGLESLAWQAARRGDWQRVEKRAPLGRGRGVRLLRLLARAHTRGDVRPVWLWLTWLVAPARREGWQFLHRALDAQKLTSIQPAPLDLVPHHPGANHLRLLAAAAEGRPVPPEAVTELARSWEAELQPLAQARLRARALALGARDPGAAAAALQEMLAHELQYLADVAPALPALPVEGPLAVELSQRLRNQLFSPLRPFYARVQAGKLIDPGTPLEEWERWLGLKTAVERLVARGGAEALRTAWHSGLRGTAWNWPCDVFNQHGASAAWTSCIMFEWVAELARRVGDAEAAATNHNNARHARAAAG